MSRVKHSVDVYVDAEDASPVTVDHGEEALWLTVTLNELDVVTVFLEPAHVRALADQCKRALHDFSSLKKAKKAVTLVHTAAVRDSK